MTLFVVGLAFSIDHYEQSLLGVAVPYIASPHFLSSSFPIPHPWQSDKSTASQLSARQTLAFEAMCTEGAKPRLRLKTEKHAKFTDLVSK